ncbi:MAG: alginate lyase family protein [Deltaproteobacteria bacterium]|jgi:poly(beta-D-mannuronate) lyase|nr:alginate lyase family protein [Deltaproteobacteria bacterium]
MNIARYNVSMKDYYLIALISIITSFISFRVLACKPSPPAIINLDVNNYYTDKKFSIIDQTRKEKHDAAVKPIEIYIQFISKQSDEYMQAPKSKKQAGSCALKWIFDWASSSALTGEMKTEQAFYERKWMLTGIALVYAKVREISTTDEKYKIENWLSKLVDLTIQHSELQKSPRNNHYYWEGLAAGAVGKITNQDKYINWASKVFAFGMNEIQTDGSLPKEMNRGQRALHYHLFSAAPLVFLSSILNSNSPKLKLLVDFTFQALTDPSGISKMSGVSQETEKDRDMAWLEIYLRRNPDIKIEKFLKPKRPLSYNKLGGNLTLVNPLECPAGYCK